jgi:hypothetical protein
MRENTFGKVMVLEKEEKKFKGSSKERTQCLQEKDVLVIH